MVKERHFHLPIKEQEIKESLKKEIKKLREENRILKQPARELLIQEIQNIARRKGETPTLKEFLEVSLTKNAQRLIYTVFQGYPELIWEAGLLPRQKHRKK